MPQLFIRDIRAKFVHENIHNSRASNDIDTKLRPVSKLDKKNTAT